MKELGRLRLGGVLATPPGRGHRQRAERRTEEIQPEVGEIGEGDRRPLAARGIETSAW
jgi:hypothetical protein